MTEIVFNEKEKQLELSVRIFTDDLEKQLSKDCGCKVDFSTRKDSARQALLLQTYLDKALKIKSNNKSNALHVIGFEKEEESIWTYLESPQTEQIKTIEINNAILYQTQSRQSNLVRVKVKAIDKTHQLQNPEEKLTFNF